MSSPETPLLDFVEDGVDRSRKISDVMLYPRLAASDAVISHEFAPDKSKPVIENLIKQAGKLAEYAVTHTGELEAIVPELITVEIVQELIESVGDRSVKSANAALNQELKHKDEEIKTRDSTIESYQDDVVVQNLEQAKSELELKNEEIEALRIQLTHKDATIESLRQDRQAAFARTEELQRQLRADTVVRFVTGFKSISRKLLPVPSYNQK